MPIQFINGEAGGAPEAMFVRFINNDSVAVRPVSWLYAPDTLDYKTLLWQYSSDTALQPNEGFVACLAWLYDGVDNGEYLAIPMEDGSSSRNIPIIHPFLSVNSPPQTQQLISLSPNPASNFITLRIPNLQSASVEIMDVLGRMVFKNNFDNPHEIVISTAMLLSGTYFITVQGIDSNGNNFSGSLPLSIR